MKEYTKMKTKQNAVDLTDLAIGIVVLGIVVTIGATILLHVRDTSLTDSSVVAYTESITPTVAGTNTLSNTWVSSVTGVVNATGGETVAAGNYSVSVNDFGVGTFDLTDAAYNNTALNVTYNTYDTANNHAYSLADNAAAGIAEYGNWFDIIVIVGVAAVILSLIFMAFGRAGGGKNNGDTLY